MRTALPSCWVRERAHANGVAGSFLVPTTTIGGAVGAWTGAAGAPFTGHGAHATECFTIDRPSRGAACAAAASMVHTSLTVPTGGPSAQPVARNASSMLPYEPSRLRSV